MAVVVTKSKLSRKVMFQMHHGLGGEVPCTDVEEHFTG